MISAQMKELDRTEFSWYIISVLNNETVTNCHGLKMQASDGKMRLADVADTEQLLRLIQSILSPKAELFKLWLEKGINGLNKPKTRNWHSRIYVCILHSPSRFRFFSFLLVAGETIRHFFTVHLLGDGTGIRTVRALLGHVDGRTTMIYR